MRASVSLGSGPNFAVSRRLRILAALNHPGIATLHGLESSEEGPLLVMELVEGETLAHRLSRGPLSIEEALPLFRQIAEALEFAHAKTILHRDLKPSNIMVTPEGQVKLPCARTTLASLCLKLKATAPACSSYPRHPQTPSPNPPAVITHVHQAANGI